MNDAIIMRGNRAMAMLLRQGSPATRNRTRDHLIAAEIYSQMIYQLSYSRLGDPDGNYNIQKQH